MWLYVWPNKLRLDELGLEGSIMVQVKELLVLDKKSCNSWKCAYSKLYGQRPQTEPTLIKGGTKASQTQPKIECWKCSTHFEVGYSCPTKTATFLSITICIGEGFHAKHVNIHLATDSREQQVLKCQNPHQGLISVGLMVPGGFQVREGFRKKNLYSGTTKKFWVPDHGSRTATMAKFRAFLRNPDLFRTIFLTFPDF